jgi:hypothetical protein
MASSHLVHRSLFQLSRFFRDSTASPPERVEELFALLFGERPRERLAIQFERLSEWDENSLHQALALAEEVIAQYVLRFHDLSILPVTYYKRERLIRRHLDQQFSRLFKEVVRRTEGEGKSTLIVEEPIYYLSRKFRERGFPKPKNPVAVVEVLKSRFHSELTQFFGRDPFSENPRRVLLPHEIR